MQSLQMLPRSSHTQTLSAMVISTTSLDLSLAPFTSNAKTYISSLTPVFRIPRFLSFPSSNSRFHVTNSSGYPPSSCVSDANTRLPTTFVVSLDYKSENLNDALCTLFRDSQSDEIGFQFYLEVKGNQEFRPDNLALDHLLKYLVRSNKWDLIFPVLEDFRKSHVLPDSFSCSKLITACIKAKKFGIAEKLLDYFESYEVSNALVFDSALRGYNRLRMFSCTIAVFERMKSSKKIEPDLGCYSRVMEAYHRLGNAQRVVELFREFESANSESPISFSAQMYRILCHSLGSSGRAFEALELFKHMRSSGISGDPSIYSALICSFASIKEVKIAEEVFKEAQDKKMLRDPEAFLKLVLVYIENGSLEKTLEIVKTMKLVNVKVSDCLFCAIVNGYFRKKGPKNALKIYEELLLQGCQPGQVTYALIINLYSRLGLHSKAEIVFAEMDQNGYEKCVVAYSNMIAMYGRVGRVKDAMNLVARMKEKGCQPNVWIYNALLNMHGRSKNLRQVEDLWNEMKKKRLVLDKVSYTSVICAYSKAREFETCIKFYREYMRNGGVIDRAMAGIMVGVFSKTNQLDELLKLLQDMKSQGTALDGRLYRSALNALMDAGLQRQANWLQESFRTV